MSNIKSMTGFASMRLPLEQGLLTLDLKSVNNRYFELYSKLPDQFRYLEGLVRERLKAVCVRGKFEFYMTFTPNERQSLNLNRDLVDLLCSHLDYIKTKTPDSIINAVDLLNFEGVLVPDEKMQQSLDEAIKVRLDELIADFLEARDREGERLAEAIVQKLDALEEELKVIENNLASLVVQERDKLKEKLALLEVDPAEERFEQEVALLAQKSDIAEEYDRIQSHVKEVRGILEKGGICGKRLDFMMQEFNREVNTMASKASNLDITRTAVNLKVLVEQMREQVQNIE